MAKETTEKFNIRTIFTSPEDKIRHTWASCWRGGKIAQLDHTGSDDLTDNWSIKLEFPNAATKFRNLFINGEWVKSSKITLLNSTPLTDEFEVEVTYKGGQKDFEKTFHKQGGKKIKYTYTLISSKTKNLGVLKPCGEKITDEHKETLNIMRLFFIEALKEAGLKRQNTIPKKKETGKFSIAVNNGGEHFYSNSRVICVHLARWKLGFVPIKNEPEKFEIQLKAITYLNWKNEPRWNDVNPNLKSLQIYKTWEIINDAIFTGRKKFSHNRFFIGDPGLDKKLIEFFKEIETTAPPPLVRK